jgi:addiction module RelE/StbE family toxin
MARYKVFITESAENDILDICRYISTQLESPMTALDMVRIIRESLTGLSDMPEKHPLIADERLSFMGYRKLPIKNYIAFYTVDESVKTVNVERILYARRDWLRIL